MGTAEASELQIKYDLLLAQLSSVILKSDISRSLAQDQGSGITVV